MKKTLLSLLFFAFFLIAATSLQAASPPQVGGKIPDLKFPMPSERADKAYLGLSGWGSTFLVPEIKARVVILEILSMYCPFCQKEAPLVNDLFAAIEKDPSLKGKIKILGIGAGNSAYEVEVFRKKYSVPFPVVPDPDYAAHKAYGEVRTPYFVAVKIAENGTHEVIYSKLGTLENVNAFLNMLRKAAGL